MWRISAWSSLSPTTTYARQCIRRCRCFGLVLHFPLLPWMSAKGQVGTSVSDWSCNSLSAMDVHEGVFYFSCFCLVLSSVFHHICPRGSNMCRCLGRSCILMCQRVPVDIKPNLRVFVDWHRSQSTGMKGGWTGMVSTESIDGGCQEQNA